MSFGSGIAGYAKRTKLGIDEAVVAINSKLSRDIILATPIDTGRARGNWIATIGSPSSESSDSTNVSSALSNSQSIANESAGKVFYLANNLPYIHRLEYNSWSTQAPNGMVRVSLQNIKSLLRKFSESR